jgi:hypothetical protein
VKAKDRPTPKDKNWEGEVVTTRCAAIALALALSACAAMPNACYVSDEARWQFVPGYNESKRSIDRALRPIVDRPAPLPAWRSSVDLTKPGPRIGSPEWEAEQAEQARKDQALARRIGSICRGC